MNLSADSTSWSAPTATAASLIWQNNGEAAEAAIDRWRTRILASPSPTPTTST